MEYCNVKNYKSLQNYSFDTDFFKSALIVYEDKSYVVALLKRLLRGDYPKKIETDLRKLLNKLM